MSDFVEVEFVVVRFGATGAAAALALARALGEE
jgi:hypothetical protein